MYPSSPVAPVNLSQSEGGVSNMSFNSSKKQRQEPIEWFFEVLGQDANAFSEKISTLTPSENIVRTAILLRLAEGKPTNIKDLNPIEKLIGVDIPSILQHLSELDLVHWDKQDGKITVAYPFSGVPTPHRVALSGKPFTYAMCAIDALGISPMMGAETDIESVCAYCGETIRLHVTPQTLTAIPDTVVVGFEPVEEGSNCCRTEDTSLATNCCPGIQFYCSKEHWNNATGDGKYLSLTDAYKYATRVFGAVL
jgi:hypothetical protein